MCSKDQRDTPAWHGGPADLGQHLLRSTNKNREMVDSRKQVMKDELKPQSEMKMPPSSRESGRPSPESETKKMTSEMRRTSARNFEKHQGKEQ